jgi:hypothetical protein
LLLKIRDTKSYPFIEKQLSADELDALQRRLEEEGFIVVHFGESKIRSKEALMEEFDRLFNFPWYFGKNWDAVDDCLSDLSWMPGKGYLLAMITYPELGLKDFYLFLDVIRTASSRWNQKGIPFKLLVPPFHVMED